MTRNMKKSFLEVVVSLLIILFFFSISIASADSLIPCAGADDCNFDAFILLFSNVINFLLFDVAIPLSALVFAYAGWLYLSSGLKPDQRTKAKGIFGKVLLGIVIALAAWLIVKAIMVGLGFQFKDLLPSFFTSDIK